MIHVFYTNISRLTEADYRLLYRRASPERRHRADRYLRKEDSLRCVTADALLRCALGTHVFQVDIGESGKPGIRGRADFHYNLSHSGPWVVLAFGDSPVGVDVEAYREDLNIRSFANRFFTPEEARYCLNTTGNPYHLFFQIWTGKESYLKYLGTGLKKALSSFSVFAPEDGVRIHHQLLPDGSSLSLCTTEEAYRMDFLSGETLLFPG